MNKKVLMVIAKTDFRDEEYVEPRKIFEQANFEVEVASTQRGACLGKMGMETYADHDLDQVDPAAFDAIVFVGGGGAQQFFDDQAALELARNAARAGRLIAAICIAPVILANAGLLRGRQATVTESEARLIEEKGAKYIEDMPVVKDGHIITASGPAASIRFGEVVRDELLK